MNWLMVRGLRKKFIFKGSIVFDNEGYDVFVVVTDSEDTLIGTKLLREKILTINFSLNRIEIVDADAETFDCG